MNTELCIAVEDGVLEQFTSEILEQNRVGYLRRSDGRECVVMPAELLADVHLLFGDETFLARISQSLGEAARAEGDVVQTDADLILGAFADSGLRERLRNAVLEARAADGDIVGKPEAR